MDKQDDDVKRRAKLAIVYGVFFFFGNLYYVFTDWTGMVRIPVELCYVLFFGLSVYILVIISGIGLLRNKSWVDLTAAILIIALILRFILQIFFIVMFIGKMKESSLGDILISTRIKDMALRLSQTLMDCFVWLIIRNSIQKGM